MFALCYELGHDRLEQRKKDYGEYCLSEHFPSGG